MQIYRALAGSLQLARQPAETEVSTIASTFGDFCQSSLVVAALALGLIVAHRAALLMAGEKDSPAISNR
jgi:hypothetical protein